MFHLYFGQIYIEMLYVTNQDFRIDDSIPDNRVDRVH
jgi:hypothetical protein